MSPPPSRLSGPQAQPLHRSPHLQAGGSQCSCRLTASRPAAQLALSPTAPRESPQFGALLYRGLLGLGSAFLSSSSWASPSLSPAMTCCVPSAGGRAGLPLQGGSRPQVGALGTAAALPRVGECRVGQISAHPSTSVPCPSLRTPHALFPDSSLHPVPPYPGTGSSSFFRLWDKGTMGGLGHLLPGPGWAAGTLHSPSTSTFTGAGCLPVCLPVCLPSWSGSL